MSDFHDPGTVSATLRDATTSAPIAGQPVSFSLNGTESCVGTTLANGSVSCSVTPTEQAGTYPLKATFAGDAQHNATTASASYAVTLEETTLKYTGPTVLATNGATLTAVLKEDGVTPINGRTVTIKLSDGTASQTCTGTTDTNGNASCTISPITVALGNDTITATFAGDPFYQPSNDTVKAIVFAFPTSGAFVVGDKTSSGKVNFWGSQWTKDNGLSTGPAPDAFKGFAATTSKPPATGNPWSTDPANSPPPPSSVPSYMGVIVASHASQTGSTISGNTVHIVVVKTDPGYAPDPGHRGTGTVVATFS
ncbi:MAG: Ig-like domain repeat protein [Pseudonocardiales bacterium]|nr:Ig-like domain repeat protein [Pseudonocardiales bacterium]